MLRDLVATPGKYIVACPRINLIQEHEKRIAWLATERGTTPQIVPIHSNPNNSSKSKSVVRRLEDAIKDHDAASHVVVLITHETMMQADFSLITSWHLRIDEIPSAVVSGHLNLAASWPSFDKAYDLIELPDTGYYRVVPRKAAPTQPQVLADDYLKEAALFLRRAKSNCGVLVNVSQWDLLKDPKTKGEWWSAWTPEELTAFASVEIAGSNYTESLFYKAYGVLSPGRFPHQTISTGTIRTGSPEIRIHFFMAQHVGSTTYWATQNGQNAIAAVLKSLKKISDLGFWSGNDMIRKYFFGHLSGQGVSPKVAGSNEYRHLTSCALIYSAKALPSDYALQRSLGLTKDQVQRGRETEDIIQFVMRGAIRCPDFNGRYDIYLYDKTQADALKMHLEALQISTNITLVHNPDAAKWDLPRAKPGTKANNTQTPKQVREKKREQNRLRQHKKRLRDKAQRTPPPRPRGRPRKNANTENPLPRTPREGAKR